MRSHSHCRRNKLAREGGCSLPSLGRSPGGTKNREMNPASSSMPSDWYEEKSPAAATNDRKQTKQTTNIARGQRFNTSPTDAIIPIQHRATSMCEPLEIQSSVGAYQKRAWATPDRATACR